MGPGRVETSVHKKPFMLYKNMCGTEGWKMANIRLTSRSGKVEMGERIEDNKNRDTIIEGDILGLQRNQALGKCLEIYKNDTS